ncbi:MAG: hypothetical protein ABIO94_09760 [Opitutaceae bacterium]
MRYSKVSLARTRLRKFASALVTQRAYPVWIDADSGVPFSACAQVSSRVRDSLVLRLVAKRHHRDLSDVRGAR